MREKELLNKDSVVRRMVASPYFQVCNLILKMTFILAKCNFVLSCSIQKHCVFPQESRRALLNSSFQSTPDLYDSAERKFDSGYVSKRITSAKNRVEKEHQNSSILLQKQIKVTILHAIPHLLYNLSTLDFYHKYYEVI